MNFPVILTDEEWKAVAGACRVVIDYSNSPEYKQHLETALEAISNAKAEKEREIKETEGYRNNNWMVGEKKDR